MDYNALSRAFINLKKKNLGRGYIELPSGISPKARVRIRKRIKRRPTRYMIKPIPSLLRRGRYERRHKA